MKCRHLAIEITRKCNKNCAHCMRGESQNLSITPLIIDKIFENIEDCEMISLMGGETLLEIQRIDYLVDKIINNWNTYHIQLTTNGTIRDAAIIDVLKKFCESGVDKEALLIVSNDKFHNQNDSKETYNFYNELLGNYGRITLKCKDDLDNIKYTGRAVKYIDEHPETSENYLVAIPFLQKHRIKVVDDFIYCSLYVCANGNVYLDEEISFELLDSLSFGNISNKTLADMIKENNDECLLTCCDYENLMHIQQRKIRYNDIVTSMVEPNAHIKIADLIFNKIYELRKEARERFPFLTPQEIIIRYRMPKDYIIELNDIINKIYNCYAKYQSLRKSNGKYTVYWEIINSYLKEAKLSQPKDIEIIRRSYTVLALLTYPHLLDENITKDLCASSEFYKLAIAESIEDTDMFDVLVQVNKRCEEDTSLINNTLVLPCNMGDEFFDLKPNIYKKVEDRLLSLYGGYKGVRDVFGK